VEVCRRRQASALLVIGIAKEMERRAEAFTAAGKASKPI